MARIKRNRNARSHREIKHRRRKPNIPELVYKFLVGTDRAARDEVGRAFTTKCRCCGQEKPCEEEIVDSADSPRAAGTRGMGYRIHKDAGKVSKSHGVKRRPTSKDLPMSYLQKCVGGKGATKARKYMKKALEFGVESGYLIPSDPTYKVLRVSSDLMKSDSRRRNKISTCDGTVSQEVDNTRDTPGRLEDLQVQEQRRRRRGRRRRGRRRRSRSDSRRRRRSRRGRRRRRRRSRTRSRSRSRSRGGRRASSPQNPEEVAEDEATDYEIYENDPKSNIHTDDIERAPKTTRSNPPDEEQSTKKAEEDGSDLSIDEDETDDEEEKKRANTTKS